MHMCVRASSHSLSIYLYPCIAQFKFGHKHYRYFSESEFSAAHLIRKLRSFYGLNSPCEDIITIVSCL